MLHTIYVPWFQSLSFIASQSVYIYIYMLKHNTWYFVYKTRAKGQP
jgi:hypothetical protein